MDRLRRSLSLTPAARPRNKIDNGAEESAVKKTFVVLAACCALAAAASLGARAGRNREGHREIPADAQGRPVEQSRTARRRPRRGAVEDAARPEQRHAREMRSRQGAGRGRRRVRRTAALFRRRRQGDGPRDAPDVVHGEAAGLQPRRSGEAAASGRRPAGEGPRRDRDLCRQQVERHEVRGQARPAAGEGRGRRRATRIFFRRSGAASISPAPPATTIPASASGCRACRICPSRRRQARSSASGRPIASRPRR